LAASDVFVFPSLYEGLGVSLLEAMAAGLPVVTTDRPPMNEIVQTGINGLLIPAGDPAALATAVVHLAEDPPTRSRLGEAAKRTVTSQFNIEGVVRQVEGLYLEVLGLETPPT
jgi:glycosyltransferase involved in cell wall biosynthesis